MEETRRNTYVGLFVLCGLLGLGGLVILFGEQPTRFIRSGMKRLHIQFGQVSDIREGNLVTVRGITIGRVVSVGLVDPGRFDAGVDVTVAIEQQYKIRQGSTAQTFQAILGQGRPPIEILPGPDSAVELAEGAMIQGTVRQALDSVFPPGVVTTFETAVRQIGDAAEAATPALRELEDVLKKRSPAEVDQGMAQGNLSSSFARLDTSLKHFNDVLGDPNVQSQLRDTIANIQITSDKAKVTVDELNKAAADFRGLMDDGRKFVANTDQWRGELEAQIADAMRTLTDGLDKADRFMDYLNTIGQQVTAGEGNVGRLFMDSKLYESMLETAQRLALAVDDFRALIAEWRKGKIRVSL